MSVARAYVGLLISYFRSAVESAVAENVGPCTVIRVVLRVESLKQAKRANKTQGNVRMGCEDVGPCLVISAQNPLGKTGDARFNVGGPIIADERLAEIIDVKGIQIEVAEPASPLVPISRLGL